MKESPEISPEDIARKEEIRQKNIERLKKMQEAKRLKKVGTKVRH